MDFEEMNRRAYNREPMPDGLDSAVDIMFWKLLNLLYALFYCSNPETGYSACLSYDEGVRYKEALAQDYHDVKELEHEWLRCKTAMKFLRQHENPAVRDIAAEVDSFNW